MAWTLRPVVNSVVLAPRIGAIVSDLLGVSGVRLYHDNTLSRCPGSQRTKWHCDDGPDKHMAMANPNVVTVWVPLQTTPPEMGSLAFASPPPRGHDAWSIRELDGCPDDEKSDAYDRFVATSLEAKGVFPDQATYELGDISIHLTSVYHCAGPNLTTATRMIIGSTYFEDGATMRDDVSLEGRRAHDFQTFVPDTAPGEVIATKLNPLLDQPTLD
jgi:ectoine hydroxylase-related dioxygenase (phytanoyl-CoA dioxygenase family)